MFEAEFSFHSSIMFFPIFFWPRLWCSTPVNILSSSTAENCLILFHPWIFRFRRVKFNILVMVATFLSVVRTAHSTFDEIKWEFLELETFKSAYQANLFFFNELHWFYMVHFLDGNANNFNIFFQKCQGQQTRVGLRAGSYLRIRFWSRFVFVGRLSKGRRFHRCYNLNQIIIK